MAGTRVPRDGFHDQLDGFQPPAGGCVVQVAHAEQALAIALEKLLGAVLAGTQGEASFHGQQTAVRPLR